MGLLAWCVLLDDFVEVKEKREGLGWGGWKWCCLSSFQGMAEGAVTDSEKRTGSFENTDPAGTINNKICHVSIVVKM